MAEKENNKSYFAIIPADVRYDKELPMGARLLYGEFTALSNQKGYCYASNNYFAELYDVTPQAISKWIKLLEKKNYIKLDYIYNGKETKERHIYIQVSIPTKKDDLKQEVSTGIDRVSTGIDRGYQHRIKENNKYINNTPNNTLGEEKNETQENKIQGNETQEITDPLKINQKDSEAEDETEYQKETGMNSDSQYLPDDGPCPWEKPVKKSKPKVPLPDCEPVNVEAIVLKDGREWVPDGYFLQEMIRLHPKVDVKAEFMAMRGWCISNPTKRKTRGGIKRFVSGWLDRAQNKPQGNGYSNQPQKHREAFIDGERDYSNTDDW